MIRRYDDGDIRTDDLHIGGDENIVDFSVGHVRREAEKGRGEEVGGILHACANGSENVIVGTHVEIAHQDAFFFREMIDHCFNGIFLLIGVQAKMCYQHGDPAHKTRPKHTSCFVMLAICALFGIGHKDGFCLFDRNARQKAVSVPPLRQIQRLGKIEIRGGR